jgi:hypothetical protein
VGSRLGPLRSGTLLPVYVSAMVSPFLIMERLISLQSLLCFTGRRFAGFVSYLGGSRWKSPRGNPIDSSLSRVPPTLIVLLSLPRLQQRGIVDCTLDVARRTSSPLIISAATPSSLIRLPRQEHLTIATKVVCKDPFGYLPCNVQTSRRPYEN